MRNGKVNGDRNATVVEMISNEFYQAKQKGKGKINAYESRMETLQRVLTQCKFDSIEEIKQEMQPKNIASWLEHFIQQIFQTNNECSLQPMHYILNCTKV